MLTPTQLIFKAYQNTPKPLPLPNGKEVEWPIPEMQEVPDKLCWLCGGETSNQGRLAKDVIRKTFTNTPYARAIESESLCTGCGWILAQRFIRNWSLLVVDDILEHPDRKRIREILIEPPRTYPWMLSIAVSGQKHISFPGKTVRSPRNIWVLFEQIPIQISETGIGHILAPVEELYNAGFTKAEILSGQYRQDRIRAEGLSWWHEKESQIASLRGSQMLELAIFVAQQTEEKGRNDLSFTDSIQTTKTQQLQHSVSTQSIGAETQKGSKLHRTSGESSKGQSAQLQNGQQLSLFG
jgi:hypothetical protein